MTELLNLRIPRAATILFGTAWLALILAMFLAWTFDGGTSDEPDEVAVAAGNTAEPTDAASTATARPPSDDATLVVPEVHDEEEVGEGAVSASAASSEVDPADDGVPNFTMPLREFSHWTDRFGANRGRGFIHGGIDLALEGLEASRVYSACPGRVSAAEYSNSYGYYVVVDCGGGWATLYAHLSQINVDVGQEAVAVTVLGITGSSGFSTGEHLHFEIIYNGTRTNPENYLDFGIPPGTPLSDGPLWFPATGGGVSDGAAGGDGGGSSAPPPTPTNTPTATPTPTDTPIPTATTPPQPTPTPTPIKPTPRPTSTPTATPTVPPPTATPTATMFIP